MLNITRFAAQFFTCWVSPTPSHLLERSRPWGTLLPPSLPGPRVHHASETACHPHPRSKNVSGQHVSQPARLPTPQPHITWAFMVEVSFKLGSSSTGAFRDRLTGGHWGIKCENAGGQWILGLLHYLTSVPDRTQSPQKVRRLQVEVTVDWKILESCQSCKHLTDCGLSTANRKTKIKKGLGCVSTCSYLTWIFKQNDI